MAHEKSSLAIDTNVILRQLLNDHDAFSPRSRALFKRVQRGEEEVFCPDTAIFEALHILTGLKKVSRSQASSALLLLIDMPKFRMGHKDAIRSALQFWKEQPALDYADCYHLVLTRARGMTGIYTFDRKMDRYPGVERVEP